jgi:hypothetical protein
MERARGINLGVSLHDSYRDMPPHAVYESECRLRSKLRAAVKKQLPAAFGTYLMGAVEADMDKVWAHVPLDIWEDNPPTLAELPERMDAATVLYSPDFAKFVALRSRPIVNSMESLLVPPKS